MTLEQTIKKAIEGGWYGSQITKERWSGAEIIKRNPELYSAMFLDPLFWECLSKAMKWGRQNIYDKIEEWEQWKQKWHDFIDHLASGKDAKSFFKEL